MLKNRNKYLILISNIALLILYFAVRFMIREAGEISWDKVVFNLDTGDNSFKVRLWHNYNTDSDYLFLPAFAGDAADKGNGTIKLSIPVKYRVTWDDVKISGNRYYNVNINSGLHKLKVGKTEFNVNVMISSQVPALFIETESGSLSHIEEEKGNGEPAMYRLISPNGDVMAQGELSKLRSRGNVTFLEDKKPYQMNLSQPEDLLGAGLKDKYILLANRQDQSLIRNSLIFDIARGAGLDYTPESIYIDLFINDDYRGSYQLCTKIDTGAYGINIDTDSRTARDYLVSLEYSSQDRLEGEDYVFQAYTGQWISIKRPDRPSEEQIEFIKDDINLLLKEIEKGTGDRADSKSFVKKYLVEEYSKNLDAMHASQYFYTMDQHIYAGPVWDYDKSLGNPLFEDNRPVDFKDPLGIYAATVQNGASFWHDLYTNEDFRDSVKEEFKNSFLPVINSVIEENIGEYKELLLTSGEMDYIRWDTLEDQKYGREEDFLKGYEEQLSILQDFMEERRDFLKDIWIENRKYDLIPCDPAGGVMYVLNIDAVEGRKLSKPRKPVKEGFEFSHWIRTDTGEPYDFDLPYGGEPFSLKAVYK